MLVFYIHVYKTRQTQRNDVMADKRSNKLISVIPLTNNNARKGGEAEGARSKPSRGAERGLLCAKERLGIKPVIKKIKSEGTERTEINKRYEIRRAALYSQSIRFLPRSYSITTKILPRRVTLNLSSTLKYIGIEMRE